MRLRLHIKFALWLLLAGILPLAIVGGYSLVSVERTVRYNTYKAFMFLAEERAGEVNRIIHNGVNSVYFLAENLMVTGAIDDLAIVEEELVRTQRFNPIIKDLTLLDKVGNIRASANYSFRGDWATTSWFRQAIVGKRVFTGVHAVLYPFDVVMTTAAPVFDAKSSEIIGVLVGQLSMEPISRIFRDIELGTEARSQLIDKSNTIVASPDVDEVLTPAGPEIGRLLKDGYRGSGHIVRNNRKELIVFASLPSEGGYTADWHILISQPVEYAYGATDGLKKGLIWAAAVALATVAIVSTVFSRHINSRIGPLITATRRLGEKEYPLHLQDLGQDEIGELGEAFVKTATALAQSNNEVLKYQETLEELVESRTEALQQSNEQLQQQIEERSKMEEERKELEELFRQSQKMEAVGTLAGGIAHDFNNILQMISGQVQLLLMKKEHSDPDHSTLSEIDKTIFRASELVRRLLTFSRKMDKTPQQMNLNDMVETTINLLSRTLPKMVTIETHLEENLAYVIADYNQMEQILMNLAANGADAMPDGGILRIETLNHQVAAEQSKFLGIEPGAYVVLIVSDTGLGMEESVKKRIFEPFFSCKEIGKGTGLGLSTVYGIIQDHTGHITCTSEPGKGTKFTLYIPATNCVREDASVERRESDSTLHGGLETILVVDDETIVREIAEDMLSRFGYKIYLGSSGEEALALYRDRRDEIDLIITDLGMPGMGGEKFIQNLRSFDPEIKVIVASGYLGPSTDTEASSLGAQAFIQKPYQLKGILKTIRKVLDRR